MPEHSAREKALADLAACALTQATVGLHAGSAAASVAALDKGADLSLLAQSAAASTAALADVGNILETAANTRYLVPRDPRWRPAEGLLDRLQAYEEHQDFKAFRSAVRMEPGAFHALAEVLKASSAFQSCRGGPAAVELQLAVALYRFGHATSVPEVAEIAAVSVGSVLNYTRRVVEALCNLEADLIPWASGEEKTEAKSWVAHHSGVRQWGQGWAMVDGTHVPLAARPGSGNDDDFINRKGTFSLNVQVVTLPTSLRIIAYVVGPRGRESDNTVWSQSHLAQAPALYLDKGEFIWADLGYPLSKHLVRPFGHGPSQRAKDLRRFNYWHSRVRIRAEHAIGFLKGRFKCLRGLPGFVGTDEREFRIQDTIIACIAAHNLAMSWDDASRYAHYIEDGLGEKLADDAQLGYWWQPSDDRRDKEQLAWTERRAAEHRRRERAARLAQQLSQRQQDEKRRSLGRGFREVLHQALFRSHGYDWRDTHRLSRLKEMTIAQYCIWKRKQAKAARRARKKRRQRAAQ